MTGGVDRVPHIDFGDDQNTKSADGPFPLSVAVVLVAAGRGRRLGGEIPKQYIPLDGPPALSRSAAAFLAIERVTAVLPVIHPDDCDLAEEALSDIADSRLLSPVTGGDTRAASVCAGLEALESQGPDRVLIHDAARPFVPGALIEAVIDALDIHEGACAALPVVDALWRAEDAMARAPVPRDGLWRAQTPQGFRFAKILAAHKTHDGSGTDDVSVAHEAGMDVLFVDGSEANYKITTIADLERALLDVNRGRGPDSRTSSW